MSCTATPPADPDGSTVYAACHPACVTISTALGTGTGGSGFIVSHPTTALHGGRDGGGGGGGGSSSGSGGIWRHTKLLEE